MLIENDFSNYCMRFHRMKPRRITRTWSLFWYIKQYHNKDLDLSAFIVSFAQNSHSGPVIYEKIITITEWTESISRNQIEFCDQCCSESWSIITRKANLRKFVELINFVEISNFSKLVLPRKGIGMLGEKWVCKGLNGIFLI